MEPLFDCTRFNLRDRGRLDSLLSKVARYSDGVFRLQDKLEREHAMHGLRKSVSDGMSEYSRSRFNRMNHKEQDAYLARLKAKRIYSVWRPDGTGWTVPKLVYDALTCPVDGEI